MPAEPHPAAPRGWEDVAREYQALVASGMTTPEVGEYIARYPQWAEPLRAFFRVAPDAAGASTGADSGVSTGPHTEPPPEPLPLESFGKYRVLRREGRGGMGLVVRALDTVVRREVVLKVIRRGPAPPAPGTLARFRREGQLLGRLEHPHIVPLHEMGETPAGEPYLAMKLVRGHTLDELLAGRATPEDRREWFLDAFVRLCGAVGYANQQGVVHRDLKPGNVMIGQHQEVQLTDFGLGKWTGAADEPDEPPADGDDAVTGGFLGSPAYMAPEQAVVGPVDARADVFGLGGILGEILTGHRTRGPAEVARFRSHPADPDAGSPPATHERLERCGAPAPLIALCRSCLAREPARRPATAEAVADAVRAYRDGLVQTVRTKEIETATARSRTVLAYGLLAAGVLIAVAGGVTLYQNQQRRAADTDRREADAERRVADAERREADAKIARVETETTETVERLVATSRERRLAARTAPLDDIPRSFNEAVNLAGQADEQARRGPVRPGVPEAAASALAEARADQAAHAADRRLLTRLVEAMGFADTLGVKRDPKSGAVLGRIVDPRAAFARAFRQWGLDPDKDSAEVIAARIRARPVAVAGEIVAGLDAMAFVNRELRDAGAVRRLFAAADAADDNDPTRRELRRLLAESADLKGQGLDRARVRALADAVPPRSTSSLTVVILAHALWSADEPKRMEDLLREAVRAHPQDALLRLRQGSMYLYRGSIAASKNLAPDLRSADLNEAIASFETLRALRPETHMLLAAVLVHSPPRSAEARQILTQERPERGGEANFMVIEASALVGEGKLSEAAALLLKAGEQSGNSVVTLAGRLTEAQEAVEARQWEKADLICRGILAQAELFLQGTPPDEAMREVIAGAHERLAAALQKQGKTADAIREFGEASRHRDGMPSGHAYLARRVELVGDHETAVKLLTRGFAEDADNGALMVFAMGYWKRRNKLDEYRSVMGKLSTANWPDDARSLRTCGKELLAMSAYPVAEKVYRKLLDLDPEDAHARVNLGGSLNQLNRHKEAAELTKELTAKTPEDYWARHVYGWALYGQGKWADAEPHLRKAAELKPTAPDSLLMLGDTLRRLERWEDAERHLRAGLKINPAHRSACLWLAEVLRERGNAEEAAEWAQKGKGGKP